MTSQRIHFLAVAVVVLYSFGYLRAEADARSRAARVLFQQFDTVAYSSTDVLSRFDNPGPNDPNSGSKPSLPITLRLPFVQLIGGLRILGHNTMTDLLRNYTGVFVGAKGFTPPDGIGMVSSQKCYISILRPNGRSIIESDFGQAKHESLNGNDVWTWSAPPYEGYPRPTTFYVAEIENTYLLMTNNLLEFRETIRNLTSGNSKVGTKVPGWEPLGVDQYWVSRSIRRTEAKRADVTGPTQGTPSLVVLRFVIDEAMNSHIEADSSDSIFNTNIEGLPASEVLHYEPKGAGVWQASIPLSKDPATTTELFRVFFFFGFGVSL